MVNTRKTPKDFARAADEAVNEELRRGTWVVYDRYKTYAVDGDDAFVKAPILASGAKRKKRRYDPLAAKGLFLKFANLAEVGDISPETWLSWTRLHGVLGVNWHKAPVDLHSGGSHERFSIFKTEALIANRVLRLYEAATAEEDGPDVSMIRKYLELEEEDTGTPEELKRRALNWVGRIVQRRLAGHCFPKLYVRSDYSFVRSEGFGSLIGAMYLQMAWLMTATEKISRCQGPECPRIIYFDPSELQDSEQKVGAVRGVYKNKRFCSANCRVKRWQRDTGYKTPRQRGSSSGSSRSGKRR